jgi:hypothetical protein
MLRSLLNTASGSTSTVAHTGAFADPLVLRRAQLELLALRRAQLHLQVALRIQFGMGSLEDELLGVSLGAGLFKFGGVFTGLESSRSCRSP